MSGKNGVIVNVKYRRHFQLLVKRVKQGNFDKVTLQENWSKDQAV